MKYLAKVSLFLLVIPLLSFASYPSLLQEASKTISKEFTVNKDASVQIDNRYGNINVSTWSKNEVSIEVHITVKGTNASKIERVLEAIHVDFSATPNTVSAKTIIDGLNNSWSLWGSNTKNYNYKINYEVKMPVSNSVELENDYGNIFLDTLDGVAKINCDYGNITIGSLNAKENTIDLDYCNGSTIGYMVSGNVNIDYSKLAIEETQSIKINSDYSNIRVDQVDFIDFNADYGAISIGSSQAILGNSDYSAISIEEVYNRLKIEADYGSLRIEKLTSSIEDVSIDSKYTSVRIGVDPDASFDFEIELKYANLKEDLDAMNFKIRDQKPTRKYYEGNFGSNPSKGNLKIRTQYGGVTLKQFNQ